MLIAASCENSGTLSYLLEYHYQHSLGREVPDNHGRYLMHYISALGDEAATRHVLEQQNHTNAFSKDFFNAYDEARLIYFR